MIILKRRYEDTNWISIEKELVELDLSNYFVNYKDIIESLVNGEIRKIATPFHIYKLSKDRNMYKMIVSINFPTSLNPDELRAELEYHDKWWNDDRIVLHKDFLEKSREKGFYEFEFISLETEIGEEIKIWR